MKILITGEITYPTKQFAKQLVENGHELHYRGHDATMRSDDPNWDWLIRGTMVYPQRTGMSHMTLQMATKQW